MRNVQHKQVAVVVAARDNSVRVSIWHANTLSPERGQILAQMLNGIVQSMMAQMIAGEHISHSVAVHQRSSGDLIAEYQQ